MERAESLPQAGTEQSGISSDEASGSWAMARAMLPEL